MPDRNNCFWKPLERGQSQKQAFKLSRLQRKKRMYGKTKWLTQKLRNIEGDNMGYSQVVSHPNRNPA